MLASKKIISAVVLLSLCFIFSYSTCKYGFKDISPIPAEVNTFRVNTIEYKAEIFNPRLAPQLTEKLKQKIIGTTRLKQVNSDNADYDFSGYISAYYASTVAITDNQTSGNRLNVTFHLSFKNKFDDTKNQEADITRNYNFSANKAFSAAGNELLPQILSDLTEDVFNKIFSNW